MSKSKKSEKKESASKKAARVVEESKSIQLKQVKCKNDRQKEFLKCIETHEVTVCTGVAGSGKTYLACYEAIKMLMRKEVEKIVLVKSVTTLPKEEVGFIPGDLKEKMDPFMISFYGNIDKLIGQETRKRLVVEGKIEVQPLAFIRGINIDGAVVILDECQNLTTETFKTIVTRIGEGSKYIIMGDSSQCDLGKKSKSVLSKLLEIFKEDELVGTVEFEESDCVRNPIIPHLLEKIKLIESNNDSIEAKDGNSVSHHSK